MTVDPMDPKKALITVRLIEFKLSRAPMQVTIRVGWPDPKPQLGAQLKAACRSMLDL